MKKIVLSFALVCVSVLNGMEHEQKSEDVCLSNLPNDVHNEIIKMALASSNNLRDANKVVKIAEALRGVRYDNIKDFTQFVHAFADKFKVTTYEIAKKINTPLADEYQSNGYFFLRAIERSSPLSNKDDIRDMIINKITKGADINFSFVGHIGDYNDEIFVKASPLSLAIIYSNLRIVEILLEFGATVTDEVLSLAQKMITFTDVNIPLKQRRELIEKDKNLDLERMARYIERVLYRRDKDYKIHNDNAKTIYNLLFEAREK